MPGKLCEAHEVVLGTGVDQMLFRVVAMGGVGGGEVGVSSVT